MQQLREKDDANFKLVSERIKLENFQKILREEKDIYIQQVVTLQEQLESQMSVSKKLEEQLQLNSQRIAQMEKEISQLHQFCETYKRQAVDNSQLIQDLKLNTHKYLYQLKEVQQQMAEKSETLASQAFSNKRAQEEIKHLQAKLERQKKFEMAANIDEVLKEEIKEYKEQLRCPSCKVKQKDAVLTKCFHVFCYDCLQKRYDTRQRKCPKCNANFGANDFRKLYLSS
jgi:E3 ubiquitin-protein ligase BRE1